MTWVIELLTFDVF